jgi:hypothetical protein
MFIFDDQAHVAYVRHNCGYVRKEYISPDNQISTNTRKSASIQPDTKSSSKVYILRKTPAYIFIHQLNF